MHEWTDSDLVSRRDGDLLSATVHGELVGMSVERGTCFGFNEVATRVWEILATPRSVAEIRDNLLLEYEVDVATCRTELASLLDTLHQSELIDVAR